MGTNCTPLIADLFLYCYERDFLSDLHKSKRHDLIYMFNDSSRYLDDIFSIDNPEFEKFIPDIYPAELQLNKANTSNKENFFLGFKVIRHVLGFGIEFLENKDIGIFGHFMVIDFITQYSSHTYFSPFHLPDIVDLELGVLSVMVNGTYL